MIFYADIKNIAKVNMQSGNIYLNKNIFPKLPLNYQKYIIYHELGHYVLNTDCEIEADEYAFNKLAGKSFLSLKDGITLITDILPFTERKHYERLFGAIKRAAEFDYNKNKNKNALILIKNIEQMTKEYIFPIMSSKEALPFDFPILTAKENDADLIKDTPFLLDNQKDDFIELENNIKYDKDLINPIWAGDPPQEDEGKEDATIEEEKAGEETANIIPDGALTVIPNTETPEVKEDLLKKIKKIIGTNDTLKYIFVAIAIVMIYKIVK